MFDLKKLFYEAIDKAYSTMWGFTEPVGPTFHLHDDGKPPIEYDRDDWWVDQRKWNTRRAKEKQRLGKVYRAKFRWYYIDRRGSPSQLWTWLSGITDFKRIH